MDYETFKQEMTEDLKQRLYERGIEDVEMSFHNVEKANQHYESLTVRQEGSNVGVNFNIESAVAEYEHTGDDAGVLAESTHAIMQGLENVPSVDTSELTNYEAMKEKLSMERAGVDEMPDQVERKGIGTSATRAATIEKLVRIGFVERKGNKKTKYLIPTHKGVALITVMPEQIQSPSMTAEWEQKLLDVEKGIYADSSFMDEIEEMITDLVKNYKIIEDAEVLMHPALEEIGTCPCCGRHVIEKQKGYFCEDRGCSFVLWKQNRFFEALGKKMTKQTATKLLHDGKAELKGCKSQKTGKTYDTTVVMSVDENKRAVFQLSFEKGEEDLGPGGRFKKEKAAAEITTGAITKKCFGGRPLFLQFRRCRNASALTK